MILIILAGCAIDYRIIRQRIEEHFALFRKYPKELYKHDVVSNWLLSITAIRQLDATGEGKLANLEAVGHRGIDIAVTRHNIFFAIQMGIVQSLGHYDKDAWRCVIQLLYMSSLFQKFNISKFQEGFFDILEAMKAKFPILFKIFGLSDFELRMCSDESLELNSSKIYLGECLEYVDRIASTYNNVDLLVYINEDLWLEKGARFNSKFSGSIMCDSTASDEQPTMNTKKEEQRLLTEITSALESSQNERLTPILIKSIQLARLLDFHEYRIVFEIHLDGYRIDAGRNKESAAKGLRVGSWPDPKIQPKWDSVTAVSQDRSIGKEEILSTPFQELEEELDFLERNMRLMEQRDDTGAAYSAAMNSRNVFRSVLIRIKSRLLMFANEARKAIYQQPLHGGFELSKRKVGMQGPRDKQMRMTIAVIAALREELDYLVHKTSQFTWKPHPNRNSTCWRCAETESGVEIIAAYASGMGLTEAAILTTRVIMEFNPSLLFMTGVCGGFGGKGLNIGDIVIAEKAFHYQIGAFKDGKIEREVRSVSVDDRLLRRMQDFFTEKSLAQIRLEAMHGMLRPDSALKAQFGPIASADLVVKDEAKRAEAQEAERKVLAIDMESYSFLRTCELLKTSAIVIKSVTDFADQTKGHQDQYREYAKYTATEALYRFLIKDYLG